MGLKRFLRAVSSVVLVTFTALCAQPTIAALQHESHVKAKAMAAGPTADERYAKILGDIEEQSKKAKRNRGQGKPSKVEAKAIRSFEASLTALEVDVEAGFTATEQHLNDKNLAEVIKQRHRDAVALYRTKQSEFKALVRNLAQADDRDVEGERDAALGALTAFFDAHPQARKRAPLDPNNLPWRTPKKEVRAPITDPKAFKTAQFGYEMTKVAGAIPSGTALPKALPAQPNADDLAETEDVQITPAILELANQLEKNPVKIYNWVRNNIEFFPSYGSVQGSDFTLQMKRGNAFDTSSLLIALLRASGVPARYAYGTVEAPVEQVMNWVGGVTVPEAALVVMGQGGIPSAPVISGGRIASIRFEHMWVEAWVDFVPSRGAKHVQGNTRVPIDASFKQYNFTSGMNVLAGVRIDSTELFASASEGATIDVEQGWVQNLNQIGVQTTVEANRARASSYIDSLKSAATPDEIVGTTEVIRKEQAALSGTLPLKIITRGMTYSVLPNEIRHQFRYHLYRSAENRAFDDPVWSFQESLPKLVGRKVMLQYRAATQADADLISSYLPRPHADGSPIQLNELPAAVPAYARVVVELRIDNQVVASGGNFPLGAELAGRGGYTEYDLSGWDLTEDDTLVAGQASAIGLSIQGVVSGQIGALLAQMQEAKARFEAGQSSSTTAEEISEGILTLAVWRYFEDVQNQGKYSQQLISVLDRPGLSYAFLHAVVQPNKLFGIMTTSVRFPGMLMDVGHLRHLRWAANGDQQTWIRYNKMRGIFASAMEHARPELMFSDSTTCTIAGARNSVPPKAPCPEGVSAVRAIAIAEARGQKVYKLTAENSQYIEQLELRNDARIEIGNALLAGKEVTVHRSLLAIDGWTGHGYSIVDPQTGAGAYLIEGANGGIFTTSFAAGLLLGAAFGFGVASGAGALLLIFGVLALVIAMILTEEAIRVDPNHGRDYLISFLAGLGFGALPGGAAAVASVVEIFLSFFAGWLITGQGE